MSKGQNAKKEVKKEAVKPPRKRKRKKERKKRISIDLTAVFFLLNVACTHP